MTSAKQVAKELQTDLNLGEYSKLNKDNQYLMKHLNSKSPAMSAAKKISQLIEDKNNGKGNASQIHSKLQSEIGGVFMFA